MNLLDRRLLVTGAAVVTVIMTAVVATLFPRTQIVPSRQDMSEVAISEQPGVRLGTEPISDYLYLIKEHQGRIAVFVPGKDEPETILDVPVKYLPDYDRDQMRQGIPVQSYDQLVALLEDYTS